MMKKSVRDPLLLPLLVETEPPRQERKYEKTLENGFLPQTHRRITTSPAASITQSQPHGFLNAAYS